jgi:hypothetical protein
MHMGFKKQAGIKKITGRAIFPFYCRLLNTVKTITVIIAYPKIYSSERSWLRFRIIRLILIWLMIPVEVQKSITSNLQFLSVRIPIMNVFGYSF